MFRDHGERRQHPRLYLPARMLSATITIGPGVVTDAPLVDVSIGGLRCRLPVGSVKIGTHVIVAAPALGVEFSAVVKSVTDESVGLMAEDGEAMTELVEAARRAAAVKVIWRAETAHVDGYLGFDARHFLRFSQAVGCIDLTRATGIDGFGLGLLLGHLEKGARVQGCRGRVAALVAVAGFCKIYCPQDRPALHYCDGRQRSFNQQSLAAKEDKHGKDKRARAVAVDRPTRFR